MPANYRKQTQAPDDERQHCTIFRHPVSFKTNATGQNKHLHNTHRRDKIKKKTFDGDCMENKEVLSSLVGCLSSKPSQTWLPF